MYLIDKRENNWKIVYIMKKKKKKIYNSYSSTKTIFILFVHSIIKNLRSKISNIKIVNNKHKLLIYNIYINL